jgi:lipopolysaccharide cholinephosphotransferase
MQEDFSIYNKPGSPIRNVQLRMLDILLVVADICEKNNICYWIEYGTLLGAVRHKGFVPWDDDLDISVYEDDFERFQIVCKEQLPEYLFLQDPETDPDAHMGHGMIKIRDKRSLYIHGFDDFRKEYNKGVFIDVFVAKKYPKMNPKLMKFLFLKVSRSYGFFKYYPELNFKNIIGYFVYPVIYIFFKTILKVITMWKQKPYYIGVTPECYSYGYFSKYEEIFPLQEIEFEGHMLKAPNDSHVYLTNIYGDYMQIPSPEKRRTHVVYAFMDRSEGAINVK